MGETVNLVKRYFLTLEKHSLLWDSVSKKASKSLSSLENLAEQLQAASSIGPDVAINMQFPELKQQIIYKTLMSLEEELVPIANVIQEVGDATEKLNKLAVLIDNQDDANFTIDTVSLHVLLESVHDTRQYYQAQFAGLITALRCLDFRDSTSISKLRKCFIEDKDLKKHVQRSFSFGRHFISAMSAEEMS